jgi:hypothetical protein
VVVIRLTPRRGRAPRTGVSDAGCRRGGSGRAYLWSRGPPALSLRCPAAVIESKRLQREGTACAAIPLSSNGRAAVPLPMSDCFYVRHLWSPRAPAKRCSELAVAAEVRAREARGSGSRRGKSAPTGRSDGGRRRDRLRIRVPHAASSSSWAGKAQAERSAPNDGACSAHDGTSRRRGTRAGHRDASGERGSGHARTAPALGGRGASRARLRALTRPRLRVRVVDRRPIGQSASTGLSFASSDDLSQDRRCPPEDHRGAQRDDSGTFCGHRGSPEDVVADDEELPAPVHQLGVHRRGQRGGDAAPDALPPKMAEPSDSPCSAVLSPSSRALRGASPAAEEPAGESV